MTTTTNPTLADMMQTKRADAIKAVRAELWKPKPDLNKVATLALQGGITEDQASKLEAETREAQAALAHLASFDVAALQKVKGEQLAKVQNFDQQIEALEAQRRDHALRADAADAEIAQAGMARTEVYRLATKGTIPDDKVPESITKMIASREANDRLEAVVNQVRRYRDMLKDGEQRLENIRDRRKLLRRPGGGGEVVVAGGAMIPEAEALKNEESSLKEKIKIASDQLQQLEKDLAAAQAEADKAAAASRA